MKSGNPIYYWDSSVIIAYLKGENRPPGEMGGLYAIARAINSGNASLLVLTLVRVEVLDSTLRPGVGEKFRNFLTRSNVQEQAVDHYIANLAHDIRNYYLMKNARGLTVSTPDALHLATAIIYEVDEFHTFDGRDAKHLGLLPLNGSVAGHPLKITKPIELQTDMFDGKNL